MQSCDLPFYVSKEKLGIAVRMYKSDEYSVKKIIEISQISTGTFYREIKHIKIKKLKKETNTNFILKLVFVSNPNLLYKCLCTL